MLPPAPCVCRISNHQAARLIQRVLCWLKPSLAVSLILGGIALAAALGGSLASLTLFISAFVLWCISCRSVSGRGGGPALLPVGRDDRDGRDGRDGRDSRDGRDGRDSRDDRDDRDDRDGRDPRSSAEYLETPASESNPGASGGNVEESDDIGDGTIYEGDRAPGGDVWHSVHVNRTAQVAGPSHRMNTASGSGPDLPRVNTSPFQRVADWRDNAAAENPLGPAVSTMSCPSPLSPMLAFKLAKSSVGVPRSPPPSCFEVPVFRSRPKPVQF
eukprot:gene28954-32147_t